MPSLSRRLVTMNLDIDQAERLERMGAERGKTAAEVVAALLQPLLDSENGEDLYWYLIGLERSDNTRISQLCLDRDWQVDELLDVLVSDAINREVES
jgi:uncharacterized protein YajQ (UPF0234 family)